MDRDSILFAMANPDPEILPGDAKKAGAAVVATGRSDFPNQVNNVLGFPGIFRGALDVRASDVNEAMKIAAAHALADLVGDKLSFDLVIPEPFDLHIAPAVAEAVAQAAMESGVARQPRDPGWVRRHTEELLGAVGSMRELDVSARHRGGGQAGRRGLLQSGRRPDVALSQSPAAGGVRDRAGHPPPAARERRPRQRTEQMPALPGHRPGRGLPGDRPGRAPGGRQTWRTPSNEGVRKGYTDGYLRKSAVADPIGARKNTGDNTPAMLHTRIVPGDKVRVIVAPKGGGAENMSALGMLKPSQGRQGAVDFVVDTVSKAGPNPCPPIIVGVGLGGTFEKAAYLAKHSLLREVGSDQPRSAAGRTRGRDRAALQRPGHRARGAGRHASRSSTSSSRKLPAHIASMPVAVNIQCHSARHKEAVL